MKTWRPVGADEGRDIPRCARASRATSSASAPNRTTIPCVSGRSTFLAPYAAASPMRLPKASFIAHAPVTWSA